MWSWPVAVDWNNASAPRLGGGFESLTRPRDGFEIFSLVDNGRGFIAIIFDVKTTTTRVFNFSSGPAVLPLPVLETAQRELLALPGVGMSILEISHRSKTFDDIFQKAADAVSQIAGIPGNYRILMLQGGASLQFSMVPMNLLVDGATADYVDAGSWGEKAINEARRVGTVNVAASTKASNYNRIPDSNELRSVSYTHLTLPTILRV